MSDPKEEAEEALRATRLFMRGLAGRLVEGSSRPNAVDYLVVLQTELADFIAARRAAEGIAPIDPDQRAPKFLSRDLVTYFAQPRSAYDCVEEWAKSYETVRRQLTQAIKVGDLFPAGHRAPVGRGRPAQLYCSDRRTALWESYRQAQE